MIFESAIICATVGLMCPAMSFLAAIFYYPFYEGFNVITLLANWLKLVYFNFPFAFFTQLFFFSRWSEPYSNYCSEKISKTEKQKWHIKHSNQKDIPEECLYFFTIYYKPFHRTHTYPLFQALCRYQELHFRSTSHVPDA